MSSAPEAQEVLRDSFGRVRDLVAGLTDGLTAEVADYRPDEEANSIAWLLWHVARVQDDHIAGLAGTDQVWTSDGWHERFGLPFEAGATGYGQTSAEVAQVHAPAELLDGYQEAVHEATLRYLDSLTSDELERIVDRNWDPPVTASVRLVSMLGDCNQHLGQAAYVRGLAERR